MRVYFHKDNSNSFNVYKLCYTQLTYKNMKILYTQNMKGLFAFLSLRKTQYYSNCEIIYSHTGLFRLISTLSSMNPSCEKIQHGNHRV